jgi:hypothetical protein
MDCSLLAPSSWYIASVLKGTRGGKMAAQTSAILSKYPEGGKGNRNSITLSP